MRRRSGSVIFPLKMKNNQEVTTLKELQENFDVEKATEYFINGKLQKWLENIYEDDIVEELEELSEEEGDFIVHFTEILGVQCETSNISIQQIRRTAILKERLKEFFPEDEIEDVVEKTAPDQKTFKQLIEEGVKKIYLLSEAFYIEKNMKELELVGVDNPLIETEETDAEQFYIQHIELSGKYKKGVNLDGILKCDTNELILLKFLDAMESCLKEMTEEERVC